MGSGLSKQQGELPLAYARRDRHRLSLQSPLPLPATSTTDNAADEEPPHQHHHDAPRHGQTNLVPQFSRSTPSLLALAALSSRRASTTLHSHQPADAISPRPPPNVQLARMTQSYSLNDLDSLAWEDEYDYDEYDELEPEEDLQTILARHTGNVKTITFAQLTNIATIGLCNQSLLAISPNIGLLSTTTTLHLCCNSITVIPPEIGHLKNLTSLHVSSNKLTSLPDTIGYLTRLVELQAADNLLTSLPASIGSLRKLTTLDLKKNQITVLPPELGQLKSLATLDVSNNPISHVPAELNRLKFLRKITLENCPLATEFVVQTTFSPPSLKELAARVIVRQQLPILEVTHSELKTYLASARQCTFCAGPYFEAVYVRGRVVERNEIGVPIEYRLCSPHWNTDEERLAALFCPLPDTAPSPTPSSLPSSARSSPPGSPLSTRRGKKSSATRLASSATLPLSSLAKNPSLPSLPAAVTKGLKTSLLRRNGLRASRSLSFISLPTAGH
ncbi:hypothetical protein HDU87_001201 [Geranomyces variabilis]|uniref:L domain-like protein n=1 Tax=Geranomyces variabilis TaxID=109894 RepID=A0AAD5TGZ8_9FUNG|nr:hypothetical protein HDU87_001201 [Geranomyces variabilis]